MTLSDLAALGSFISSVAVLVSLIYLALQVRQADKNQRAIVQQERAATPWDSSASGVVSGFSLDEDLSGVDNFAFSEAAVFDPVSTPVSTPEPLTLSLFGAGLAGAVAMRRRSKHEDGGHRAAVFVFIFRVGWDECPLFTHSGHWSVGSRRCVAPTSPCEMNS
jgi:PEP-CTERM motif